jgi:hypothetical protein
MRRGLRAARKQSTSSATEWPQQMAALYPGTAWWDSQQLSAGSVASWTDRLTGIAMTAPGTAPVRGAFPSGAYGLQFTRASSTRLQGGAAMAALLDGTAACTVLFFSQAAAVSSAQTQAVVSIGDTGNSAVNQAMWGGASSTTDMLDYTQRGASVHSAVAASKWGRQTRGASAVTYDGTTCRGLRNMVQSFSAASGSAGTCNVLAFGAHRTSGSWISHFDGLLGDVVIVPGAVLSDAEIRAGMEWMRNRYVPTQTEVWLAVGDSYMEGYALDVASAGPAGYPPPNVWMVRNPVSYVQAHYDPSGYNATLRQSLAGLFCQMRQAETGSEIILVNAAYGGLRSDQQLPGSTCHTRLVAQLTAAMAYPGASFAGVIHSSGYNEAILGAYQAGSYRTNWDTIAADIRSRAPGSWKWHYTQLPSAYVSTPPALAAVRADQAAWQSADRLMFEIPADIPRPEDNVHFRTDGNLIVAQGLYDLLP